MKSEGFNHRWTRARSRFFALEQLRIAFDLRQAGDPLGGSYERDARRVLAEVLNEPYDKGREEKARRGEREFARRVRPYK